MEMTFGAHSKGYVGGSASLTFREGRCESSNVDVAEDEAVGVAANDEDRSVGVASDSDMGISRLSSRADLSDVVG